MIRWHWKFSGPVGKASGKIDAIDVRDAVSRILTAETEPGGVLFGERYRVPLAVLQEAPGNRQVYFRSYLHGVLLDLAKVMIYPTPEGDRLLAFWEQNHAPEGYDLRVFRSGLYEAAVPVHGRRFYTALDPATGRSWLSDERAQELLRSPTVELVGQFKEVAHEQSSQ